MRKITGIILAVLLIATLAGCSSSGGYEGVVSGVCNALEAGDVKALTAFLDMENIEKGLEAQYSGGTNGTTQIDETLSELAEQEAFVHICDDLTYEFGKDYVVEHGTLFQDEEQIDLALMQRLRKLENEDETLTQTEFINSFVDSLTDAMVVETTLIFRSKADESKTRLDMTLQLYERNGKWYLDNVNFTDVQTPNLLGRVEEMLRARDE